MIQAVEGDLTAQDAEEMFVPLGIPQLDEPV